MPRSQWLEWMEFAEARGPIGGSRWDYYVALLAMYVSGQAEPDIRRFMLQLPWNRREDVFGEPN